MTATAIVLWVSLACLVYTYVGYPVMLALVASARQLLSDWRMVSHGLGRRSPAGHELPTVAVIVAMHNEEQHAAERIRNLLAQDYPRDRLTLYIGSDASTDRTDAILAPLAGEHVNILSFQQRRGKTPVVADLVALTTEDILVFTDANTEFEPDVLRKLVRHFSDPEVGCVCGDLRLVRARGGENIDHVYWRYERMLKFLESRIGALLGANGGVYALRRSEYRPIPGHAIVDDFWLSMKVVEEGRRCVYDPEAVAREFIPDRIGDEFKRRVRIGAGDYQAMFRFRGLLDPRKGRVAWSFLSHKVMRWMAPHFMVLALGTALLLARQPHYMAVLAAQLALYSAAAGGWWMGRHGRAPILFRVPWFFLSMNAALLAGFCLFVAGGASAIWTPSVRETPQEGPPL